MRVPKDFPVRPIRRGSKAASGAGVAECGTCHRLWDDTIATTWTPTPSARCPFEYFHKGG